MKVNLNYTELTIEIILLRKKRKELSDLADEIGKMITSLIINLGGSELKGTKFKAEKRKSLRIIFFHTC